MKKPATVLLLVLAILGAALSTTTTAFSDASYVSASRTTATVAAAADWAPPSVAIADPGSPLQRTVTLNATASDPGGSGVAAVTLQQLAPGATSWATICTDTTAPYSCSWDTTATADGTYDLRAKALDVAGYSTLSDSVRTVVANAVVVTLGDPGDVVRGQVPLTATIYNGGILPWLVTIQYAAAGGSAWKPLCSGLTTPYTCSWPTTALADASYDLRAVATSGTATATSAVVADVLVDNTAPAVTMTDPGSPISGGVTLAAAASDAGSDIAQVELQAALGTGSYRTLCTITVTPFSCRYDSTTLADGTYSFRALATDVAGNVTTSAAVANRVVDNTISSVSVVDPGAYLSGTVTVAAQANSTAGVASVRLQRTVSGGTTWTDLCTDTTAPYSCAWDTTTVVDGLYDLRAVLTDSRGATTTSAVISGRRVDNSVLRGIDVQTANGEGTPGRLDGGDTLTLTYSEAVAPGSISSGWSGSALPVTLRLRDGNLVGTGNRGDLVDVLRNGSSVALGTVVLNQDYIKSRKTASLAATMTATTVTVAGVARTVVTLVLGPVSTGGLRTVTTPATMSWTPSAAALSLTGEKCSAAPVAETGTADREW